MRHSMKLTAGLCAAAIGSSAMEAQTPPSASALCASMIGLSIPDVAIISAEIVPAGRFTAPGVSAALDDLPSFCRITGVARPTANSIINLEIWSPAGGAWNGKFLGVGNNAFQGVISYTAMGNALRRGYATASSDAGHTGGDLAFGIGQPEKIADWSWRSIHVTAQTAKLVIRNIEGRFPHLSYFQGCDTGGHQALMEAQRFPGDYDGIIAGNPASNRTNEIIAYLNVWLKTRDAAGESLLPAPKLRLLYTASMAACDDGDGVVDGVINDPRTCRFDPASLLCSGEEADDCLTLAQIGAAKAVYADTRNPRTNEKIFPGWPPGSEAFGDTPGQSWGGLVNAPQPRRVEFFRNFVFHNPDWDWRTFDFDRDVQFVRDTVGYIDAIDADLSAFKARGGKLIMYTGWADAILPGQDAIDYYGAISNAMGGDQTVSEFMRLYVVPGMGHCSGGPGTSAFDMLPVLERWVEHNEPPERVIASRIENGVTTHTRPLCPYPQTARWNGRGDSNNAASFTCVSADTGGENAG